MPLVELYCGDCVDIIPKLQNKGIDIMITDPPYGIGESNQKNLSRGNLAAPIDYGDFDWDKGERKKKELLACLAFCPNAIVWGGNYYTDILIPYPGWIIWDKMNTGDFADCEMAWTSQIRAARIIHYMWNGMIKQEPEKRYHPTQKPVKVMTWIIENYIKKNKIIFDPFMGVGSHGVAAVRLGYGYIGIDTNPDYCAIAEKRIKEEQAQLNFLKEL